MGISVFFWNTSKNASDFIHEDHFSVYAEFSAALMKSLAVKYAADVATIAQPYAVKET